MTILLTAIHVIVCLILIMAVLLQSGKSADLAGAFGGVGSQTAFGARGQASLLSKVTTASAILFMLTSLGLWMLSARGTRSAVSGEQAPAAQTAAPATQTTPPVKEEGKVEAPAQGTETKPGTEAAPVKTAPEKKAPEKAPEKKAPEKKAPGTEAGTPVTETVTR